MPTPYAGETRDHFIDRCMGFPDLQDEPADQRAAICYSLWQQHNKEPLDLSKFTDEELRAMDGFVARLVINIPASRLHPETHADFPAIREPVPPRRPRA